MTPTIAHQCVPDFQNMPNVPHVENTGICDTDSIVAYTLSGRPLTIAQYNEAIDEAVKQCAEGNCLANDEVKVLFEDRMSQWKKESVK